MSITAHPGLILSQKPAQVQKLVMTPQLQAAIRLLALPRVEFEQAVQKELLENPLLEDAGTTVDMDPYPAGKKGAGNSSGEHRDFETYTARAETLVEHVLTQVLDAFGSHEDRTVAAAIAGNLNRDGYLAISTGEVAGLCDSPVDGVERVLSVMQTFDPAGICARDLKECLLIQCGRSGLNGTPVETILRGHLQDLEVGNYRRISKKIGLPVKKILAALETIRALEPKPGRAFYDTVSRYIEPDLYVIRQGTGFKVILNERGLPVLRISDHYRGLLKRWHAAGETERTYLQEKMKSARWFINSVGQRRRTICSVMEAIVERQPEFFEKGPAQLKPMVLRDIAEQVGVVESTVSRAIADKYAQTPHGLLALRSFFSSGLPTDSGRQASSSVVRDRVKEIIAGEDRQKPLSDDRISDILRTSGIIIARRTVAKYRGQLGILPSNCRRVIV
jgi:RNA polymerase sigma-54 factor